MPPLNANTSKLAVALVTILAMTVLLLTNHVSESAAVGTITLIIGYILGNGVTALRGQQMDPVLGRRAQQADDDPEPPAA